MVAYFLAGDAANACVATQITPTVSPAEDALFPATNLITGNPWEIFRYGSIPTNPYIRFDMNQVKNHSFEANANGEDPTDWVQEAGTPQVSSAQFDDGAVSLALADSESAYQDIEVVAGNRYRLEAALRGNGTGAVSLRLIHLDSQQYKTTASETSYSTTASNLGTQSTAAWATTTQNFVVPSHPTGASDRTKIRIQAIKTTAGGGDVWFDDVRLYPDIDFASLHYIENFGTSTAWNIISSNNNWSSQTTEDVLPANGFRSFIKFDPSDSDPRQYWGFESTGTFYQIPSFGQFAMGEAIQLTAGTPSSPLDTSRAMPQSGVESPTVSLVTNQSPDARVRASLVFRGLTNAAQTEIQERIWAGSRHGAEGVVVVPDSARSHDVFLGRFAGEVSIERVGSTWMIEVPFVEHGFPNLTK